MAHTLPIQFLRATVEELIKRGFDVHTALQDTGLDWQRYAQERARLTPEQVTGVIHHFWRVSNDELFGLGPRPVPRGTLRLAGFTVVHSRDFRSALSRMLELSSVWVGVQWEYEIADGLVTVRQVDSQNPPLDPFVAFAMLSGLHRFAGWLTGSSLHLRYLAFAVAADHLREDYAAIFGIRPEFGASRYAIAFDAEVLARPVVRDENDLKDFLREAPGVLFYSYAHTTSTAARVRTLMERIPNGPWMTSDELAARLSISPPHLRRLLRADNTSQRRIRDEVLRDRAIESLVHGSETITDLAARLGFSETSAFRRAFRRWTGNAPSDYR
ncbi:AraC family transcriptional regulator [Gordonia polyisoprenivorans]|uniref:AraC family transcriptional regulator n=1 Tax=Gordonia polyisoprenivorans TaxID=84595 RepID=UPI0023000085|nr:AraC family transcriptional regulator [Gordonia polyisoprenivorans]WCB35351.1 AraC family transcriptional regulator ligand-binding domain-containing protein [Gordonia polyisoprenivorans]